MPVAIAQPTLDIQRLTAIWASALVALVAVVVLAGWLQGLTTLVSVLRGWPTMKVNTAVCFLMGATALFLCAWSRNNQGTVPWVAMRLLAFLVIVVPVLTVFQDALGWGHSVDRMLGPLLNLADPGGYERMSEATALAFMFAGMALLLLEHNARCIWVAQSLASSVLLLALLSLLAYLFDARLDVARPFSSMAVHTACSFVVLSAGMVALRCAALRCEQGWVRAFTRDTPTARIGRRYLASTLLALPLIAQLSIMGERNLQWYGPNFGIVILTVASIAVLGSLNWAAVHLGNEADRKLGNLRRVNATLTGIKHPDCEGAGQGDLVHRRLPHCRWRRLVSLGVACNH